MRNDFGVLSPEEALFLHETWVGADAARTKRAIRMEAATMAELDRIRAEAARARAELARLARPEPKPPSELTKMRRHYMTKAPVFRAFVVFGSLVVTAKRLVAR